jgi:hypothetical protein
MKEYNIDGEIFDLLNFTSYLSFAKISWSTSDSVEEGNKRVLRRTVKEAVS